MTLSFHNTVSFNSILGQDRAVHWLTQAFLADRLPHALIFAGPVGVGKATTARVLAALFLCQKPKSNHPCGTCPSCRVLAANNHPDYHVVYRQLIRLEKEEAKAKALPVDVVRQYIVTPAGLTASMNHGKVFVIEEAELMNTAAQNALLKTLEEPYARTLIILLTDQPESLLPTIRSRCQVVRFAPLPVDLVLRELETRNIPRPDATDVAAMADGSLGLAIKWLEDGVVPCARELRQHVSQMLAGRPPADLAAWFKSASEDYAKKQLDRDPLTSKDQAAREGVLLYLRLLSQLFRRCLAQAVGYHQLETFCSAIDSIARSEQYLDSNVNLALIFQQLAVTLENLLAPRVAAGPQVRSPAIR